MNKYQLIKHYLPEEMKDGPGTMSGGYTYIAETDEEAIEHFVKRFKLTPEDLTDDWNIENKEYSIVKLCVTKWEDR